MDRQHVQPKYENYIHTEINWTRLGYSKTSSVYVILLMYLLQVSKEENFIKDQRLNSYSRYLWIIIYNIFNIKQDLSWQL